LYAGMEIIVVMIFGVCVMAFRTDLRFCFWGVNFPPQSHHTVSSLCCLRTIIYLTQMKTGTAELVRFRTFRTLILTIINHLTGPVIMKLAISDNTLYMVPVATIVA
jgi:hypothetical protein